VRLVGMCEKLFPKLGLFSSMFRWKSGEEPASLRQAETVLMFVVPKQHNGPRQRAISSTCNILLTCGF